MGAFGGSGYTCEMCGKFITTKFRLQGHLLLHQNVKCKYCENMFQMMNLKKHVKEMHGEQCRTCSICGKVLASANACKRHLECHTMAPGIIFTCEKCPKTFGSKFNLDVHYKNNHLKGRYSCTFKGCKKWFKFKSGLRVHKRQHTGRAQHVSWCRICNVNFAKRHELVKHRRMEHGEIKEEFQCYYCEKVFQEKPSLTAHIKSIHLKIEERKTFYCEYCGMNFTSKTSLSRHHDYKHTDSYHLHPCFICGHMSKNLHALKFHEWNHNKKFECAHCSKLFARKNSMQRHIFARHLKTKINKEKPTVMCFLCGKIFKNNTQFKYHMLRHTGEKNYACGNCNKTFATSRNLYKHSFVHKEATLACEFCGNMYRTVGDLRRHQKMHDPNYTPPPIIVRPSKPADCDLCGKRFSTRSAMLRHLSGEHTDKSLKCQSCPQDDGKLYNETTLKAHITSCHGTKIESFCHICGKRFYSRNTLNLRAHIKRHMNKRTEKQKKTFKCETCSCEFFSKLRLMNHTETQHMAQEIAFTCEECNLVFVSKSHLEDHLKLHSDVQTSFVCDLCNTVFMYKKDLVLHTQTVHFGKMSHQCEVCGKAFTCAAYLKRHVTCHNESNKLPCRQCGKLLKGYSSLRSHLYTHVKEKPFSCPVCQTKFKNKEQTTSHWKKVHMKGKSYVCHLCDGKFAKRGELHQHFYSTHDFGVEQTDLEVVIVEADFKQENVELNEEIVSTHFL